MVLPRIGDVGGESGRRGRDGAAWLDMGEAGSEGDGQGQCMDEAGEEGKRDATENCEDAIWWGGEERDTGVVDREDNGEGNDWGRGVMTWADVGEAGEGGRENASFLR
jgi:hypothetical protein